jgi:hypothetical protein
MPNHIVVIDPNITTVALYPEVPQESLLKRRSFSKRDVLQPPSKELTLLEVQQYANQRLAFRL